MTHVGSLGVGGWWPRFEGVEGLHLRDFATHGRVVLHVNVVRLGVPREDAQERVAFHLLVPSL